jgi:hypothetical protein
MRATLRNSLKTKLSKSPFNDFAEGVCREGPEYATGPGLARIILPDVEACNY